MSLDTARSQALIRSRYAGDEKSGEALGGRERDLVLLRKPGDAGYQEDDPKVASAIMRGLRTRLDRHFEGHTPGPKPDDSGFISGAGSLHLTLGECELAKSKGALVVFYKSENDLVGSVFDECPPEEEDEEQRAVVRDRGPSLSDAHLLRRDVDHNVHHARIIHFPKGVKMGNRLPAHRETYLARLAKDDLGFGDDAEGLIQTDAMVVNFHDGKQWMESHEVLPLMTLASHPNMQALHYGSALFEGMGAERNDKGEICIFDMEGHYKRLMEGALDFDLPSISFVEFKEMVMNVVKANEAYIPPVGKGRLYIRPNLYSCGAKMKVGNSKTTALVLTATPIANAGGYFGKEPKEMIFSLPVNRVRRVEGQKGNRKAVGNYAETIEAIRIAKELGLAGGGVAYLDRLIQEEDRPQFKDYGNSLAEYAHALLEWAKTKWLKRGAEFTETNASNLLAFEPLENGRWRIVTPPLTRGDILEGRTRNLIRKIAIKLGWEFVEKPLTLKDATSGKYPFMGASGTAAYITPIHGFQKVEIGTREELGEIDEAILAGLAEGSEERENYIKHHVGKKKGEVIQLQGRPPYPDELYPQPIQTLIEEMEIVKRGESSDAELDAMVTKFRLPQAA